MQVGYKENTLFTGFFSFSFFILFFFSVGLGCSFSYLPLQRKAAHSVITGNRACTQTKGEQPSGLPTADDLNNRSPRPGCWQLQRFACAVATSQELLSPYKTQHTMKENALFFIRIQYPAGAIKKISL